MKRHRSFYEIGGMTIQVDADLPITEKTFHAKFEKFKSPGKRKADIFIRHHFFLPELKEKDLGEEVYRKPPWAIFEKDDSWIYLGISPICGERNLHRAVVFNRGHTRARIYNETEQFFKEGNLHSLTLFPTDQILLARVLADRNGCFLHSCGIKWRGKGFLFAGHSEAGKSTTAMMFQAKTKKAEILCDDRIIVRKAEKGFKIYGTWSHGDVPDVSSASAPLGAILFLEQSRRNQLVPIRNKREVVRRLIAVLIKPFMTADWWEKTLAVIEKMADDVPCYLMQFDKSGKIIKHLEAL